MQLKRKFFDALVEWRATAKRELLVGTLKGNAKGGWFENLFAGMLERNGHAIRYFRKDDREVEFLVEGESSVIPIEVKTGNSATVSLDGILKRDDVPFGYKLTGDNVGVAGKKITLPHYMAMFV